MRWNLSGILNLPALITRFQHPRRHVESGYLEADPQSPEWDAHIERKIAMTPEQRTTLASQSRVLVKINRLSMLASSADLRLKTYTRDRSRHNDEILAMLGRADGVVSSALIMIRGLKRISDELAKNHPEAAPADSTILTLIAIESNIRHILILAERLMLIQAEAATETISITEMIMRAASELNDLDSVAVTELVKDMPELQAELDAAHNAQS